VRLEGVGKSEGTDRFPPHPLITELDTPQPEFLLEMVVLPTRKSSSRTPVVPARAVGGNASCGTGLCSQRYYRGGGGELPAILPDRKFFM
jgi:hypothetical protein